MNITPDSQAILLLCSHLGLSSEPASAPLNRREWNSLARKIQTSPLKRPRGLLGLDMAELQKELDLNGSEVARLTELLQRNEALTNELQRLADLGIYVLTRADAEYPQRYRERLKESAPMVLFYAGEAALLGQPGIAVVGSRHLDQAGEECATFVGNACGLSGLVLYSGGAKGVDTISMNAALEVRGTAVGILAHSLEKTIRAPELRSALSHGDLCLITPYSPNAGFSVGAAMGRNKLIYTLADYAIVVASDANKGGTWSGATETLKAGWVPVFVLEHTAMPDGNRQLIEKGATAFPHPFPEHYSKLADWLRENSTSAQTGPMQLGLF